jgi:phage anti-repressor protein
MVEILNEEFTEEESRWYIANLYIYMNYHPTNDYPINLDTLVKLVGFAHKKNAKTTLENNFIKDEDYKILLTPKGKQKKDNRGGHNNEQVMLNVDTFKNMCMLVKTEKSKQIRKYYVKLENIYNKIIKEEIEENKKQLENQKLLLEQEKETTSKLTNEKMLEKHNILLREFSNIGSIVYIIKVKTFDSGEYIIKIGESRIGLRARYNDHKSNYEQAIILDCFLVKNSKNFESFLHTKFKYNKVTDLEGHKNENELFLIGKELSYSHIIEVINQNIKYYNDDYTEIEKLRLENSNLKIVKELNKDLDIKNIMCVMLNNNKMILNKIDNLEKTIIELKNELSSINTRKVNNFNEALVTLGPRLQKINPETLKLIKVYDSE